MSVLSKTRGLLQHCGRAGENTAAFFFCSKMSCRSVVSSRPGSFLAQRQRRLPRQGPQMGGCAMHARFSSSQASGGEESESSTTSETSAGSDGESTAASSVVSEQEPASSSLPLESGAPDKAVPQFAFAFDIDGVLMYSSKPIPGAAESLRYLQRHKIPFILLTNGGGKPEAERVAELSSRLGVELDVSNFVQSHTPFRLMTQPTRNVVSQKSEPGSSNLDASTQIADPMAVLDACGLRLYMNKILRISSLRDNSVLVLGSDASKARRIAHGYGFKSVITPGDILKACPQIFPFNPLHEFYDKQETLPLPKPIYDPSNPDIKIEDSLKISAILVFNDPRDWAVDVQLVVDLMLSHRGYLGTYSARNGRPKGPRGRRWQNDRQPALVFSNGDVLWSTGFHLSRFGQGSFAAAVEGAFNAVVARAEQRQRDSPDRCHLDSIQFGKPVLATYIYAEQVLLSYMAKLWPAATRVRGEDEQVGGGSEAVASAESARATAYRRPLLRNVYMVGDNPESDILGANIKNKRSKDDKGVRWTSCLVRTGVWKEEESPLEKLKGVWKPRVVNEDVRDTVNWALEQQGWPGRVGDGEVDV